MSRLILLASRLALIRGLPLPWDLGLCALPGRDLVGVEPVDLLEGAVVAFDKEEVDDENADEHASRENVTVGEVNGTRNEGSEESDEEVPAPVGRSAESHSL